MIAVALTASALALENGFRRGRYAPRTTMRPRARSSGPCRERPRPARPAAGVQLLSGGQPLPGAPGLILAEANEIGTAWLRADLLDEPQRSELRAALEDYTRHRSRSVRAARTLDDATRADSRG